MNTSKSFKTSRLMRRGAAIIKEWFIHSRSSRKCHLDWGCTTPSSIERWLCVVEARKREVERLHPPEHAHHRHELLRWLEEAGDEGRARLLSEWRELRGPTDAERAAGTSARNVARLEKKHPLFAAMGALDEVATVPTPESTLEHLKGLWEMARERRAHSESSRDRALSKRDPDAMSDDRLSLNQMRVWGRVSLGWPLETARAFSDEMYRKEMALREVDRPHIVLAREVLLANARDETHARETLGGIFFSIHAHSIENGIIGAPALRALRAVACDVFGNDNWLDGYSERGRTRRYERLAEQAAKREQEQARWAPELLRREQQLVIPLEVAR